MQKACLVYCEMQCRLQIEWLLTGVYVLLQEAVVVSIPQCQVNDLN